MARGWFWAAGAPIRVLLLGLIRLYRVTLGPLLGGQCRFHPSCSAYAEQAIATVGWARGVPLAVWRVLRCNPFSPGGIDYPPAFGRPQTASRMITTYEMPCDSNIHRASRHARADSKVRVESFRPRSRQRNEKARTR